MRLALRLYTYNIAIGAEIGNPKNADFRHTYFMDVPSSLITNAPKSDANIQKMTRRIRFFFGAIYSIISHFDFDKLFKSRHVRSLLKITEIACVPGPRICFLMNLKSLCRKVQKKILTPAYRQGITSDFWFGIFGVYRAYPIYRECANTVLLHSVKFI